MRKYFIFFINNIDILHKYFLKNFNISLLFVFIVYDLILINKKYKLFTK